MNRKMKTAAGIFTVVFCIFSGCGRKEAGVEELLLFVEEKGEDASDEGETLAALPPSSGEEGGGEKESLMQDQTAGGDGQKESVCLETCMVHICGAVNDPGVYALDKGSRVFQGIEMAGGFLAEADQDYLNLADFLSDGDRIYVPTRAEVEEAGDRSGYLMAAGTENSRKEEEASHLVNINTAGEELLCTLSGVGSSRAKSIIAYREKNGAFLKIEDIMNVEGIKDGLFRKIKDSITV